MEREPMAIPENSVEKQVKEKNNFLYNKAQIIATIAFLAVSAGIAKEVQENPNWLFAEVGAMYVYGMSIFALSDEPTIFL